MEWGTTISAIGEVMSVPADARNSAQDHLTRSLPSSSSPHLLEGFLTRGQLAEELGTSIRTLDRWEALRQGPPRVSVGRTILYHWQSVHDWLLSRERKTPPSYRPRRSSGMKP